MPGVPRARGAEDPRCWGSLPRGARIFPRPHLGKITKRNDLFIDFTAQSTDVLLGSGNFRIDR
jgi:hypothetical protein